MILYKQIFEFLGLISVAGTIAFGLIKYFSQKNLRKLYGQKN